LESYPPLTHPFRFITGLADTQIDLIRDKPSWFSPGQSLQLPYPLLEIRHRIVHRHLPSLAELKRAAQDSLDWLWEWYWSQLDHAFGLVTPSDAASDLDGPEAVREKLQAILKTYVKERIGEIKTRRRDSRAATNALSAYNMHFVPATSSTPAPHTQSQLLRLLVTDAMMLPADKKLGTSMSGAFLIWDPLLSRSIVPAAALLTHMLGAMNTAGAARAMMATDMDPVREAMCEWVVHVLQTEAWGGGLVEATLAECFSAPTYWNLRVAEEVLRGGDVEGREMWVAVLEAAKAEGEEMDVDDDVEGIEQGLPVRQGKKSKEIVKGPQKMVGMWKARPIGWVPEGWEEDE
jgi:ribosomal biogenesis protein LAS1